MVSKNPWLQAAERVRAAEDARRPVDDGSEAAPVVEESNPWMRAAAAVQARQALPESDPAQESGAAAPPTSGPASPHLHFEPAADAAMEAGLPVAMVRPTARLWVVGAHGGAGETKLAGLDPSWVATDHQWPTPSSVDSTCPCVLVARTHADGLLAAQRALRQWASGGLGAPTQLLGLVLVADAPGRLPKALRDLASLVAGGAPRSWHLDWIPAWRLGEPLTPETTPRQLRRLTEDLNTLTQPTSA